MIHKSGTSFSSPHVAGIAALLISADNSLKASEVRELIKNSALSNNAVLKNKTAYGVGIANAYEAFKLLKTSK